jgi:PAS domain S-box-containing protein
VKGSARRQAAPPDDPTALPNGGRFPDPLRAINERLLIAGLREQAAADRLRQQLAFTAALSGSIGDGIYATDVAGGISFVNPAAERLLGGTEAALLGKDAHAAFHADCGDGRHGAAASCPLAEALRTGAAYRHSDERFTRQDGTLLPVECAVAPILLAGELVGTVVCFRDITERQQAAQDRARLDAVERQARALLEAQKEAFVAAVAHDLQSPITAIKGYAQLLQRQLQQPAKRDPASLRASLEQIEITSMRMSSLVRELLDVLQLQTGQTLDMQRRPTDLNVLTTEAVAVLTAQGGPHRVQVARTASDLIGVWDGDRIARALSNLLSNAAKYSPAGGTIHLMLGREEDANGRWAVLTVRDAGVGIPAADLPHVFDRFRRGSNVAGQIAGTGIGLASVKQIVEQHGGRITLRSREGHGTTVVVRLPLAAPDL